MRAQSNLVLCLSLVAGISILGEFASGSTGNEETAAPAVSPAAPAPTAEQRDRRRRCTENRAEYRAKANKLFKLKPEDELSSQAAKDGLKKDFCEFSRKTRVNKISRSRDGACESTLMHIVNVIETADGKVADACVLMEQAGSVDPACTQVSCMQTMSTALKQSSQKLDEAKKLMATGVNQLEKFREHNAKVATAIGKHLKYIAQAIDELKVEEEKKFKEALANPSNPTARVASKYFGGGSPAALSSLSAPIINMQINSKLKEKLGPAFAKVEGEGSPTEILESHGLTVRDTNGIRKRSSDILQAAQVDGALAENTDFDKNYGHYAGEQLEVKQLAYTFEPMAESAQSEFGRRSVWMQGKATELDQRIAAASSAPNNNNNSSKQGASPSAPQTRTASASGPAVISTLNPSSSARNAGLASSTGASRALDSNPGAQLAALQNSLMQPSFAPKQNGTPSRARAETFAPTADQFTATAPSAKNMRSVEQYKKESAAKSDSATEVAAADSAMPAFSGLLDSPGNFVYAAPSGGVRNADFTSAHNRHHPVAEKADRADGHVIPFGQSFSTGAREPATKVPAAESTALEDPAQEAYVNAQIDRYEAGGRKVSPSLRDKLREKLKAGYSLRKLAAENAGQPGPEGSGSAVAELIQQMRTSGGLPGDDAQMRVELLALAGEETEAEIRRLLNDIPNASDNSYGILGTHTLSLFERVRSAHQRSLGSRVVSH